MRIKNVKQVVTWEVVGTEQRGVNPIWWFFWLIVFFPLLIFVFFIHNQDATLIQLTYQNGDSLLIKLTRDDEDWFVRKMEKIGASKVEEDMSQYQNMKQCPYCAEIIQGEAILCRYCHQKLEGDDTQQNLTNSTAN